MTAPYPSLEIRFAVGGVGGTAFALVDTGFDGYVAIPETMIASLPTPSHVDRVRTASGDVVPVPVYHGAVELIAQPGRFPVLIIALGDEFLVGLGVVNRFRVTFDHGQRIIVDP